MMTQPPARQRKPRIRGRGSSQPQRVEYIYHWNRIMAALAGLALVIALIVFAFHAWLFSSPAATPEAGVDAAAEVVAWPEVVLDAAMPQSGTSVAETVDTVEPAAVLADRGSADAPDHPESTEPAPLAGEVPEPAPVEPEAGDAATDESGTIGAAETLATPAGPADAPGSEVVDREPPEVVRDVTEPVFDDASAIRSARWSVLSPAVRRFALAPTVVRNEPRGDLADVRRDARGVAQIAAFSEVVGLNGELLDYVWIHGGREMARVRVPVRSDRWRSHSTKRIAGREQGIWRIELRDAAGTLLASGDFTI